MANENQILTFKLVIDGKEATATVQIAKKDFEDLNASINKIQDRPILKQFAKDLLLVNASAEEATTGIMDFIRYNEMTEPEIQSVINTLREEQRVLSVGSAQWRTHGQAIENLSNAYQRTIAQQRAFTGASNSARMAVGQFGFALGDASMIAVDFRMFLMSIGNNIPFIVQGLAQVSMEAKDANMSMGSFLKNNLDMSMKLVLGANALMFALTVLPSIFQKINEASSDAAEDGLKKFSNELKTMTSSQILDKLDKVKERLKEIRGEDKKQENVQQVPMSIVGGLGPSTPSKILPPTYTQKPGEKTQLTEEEKQLTEEEKKILDARTKRKAALELEIADYDKLIDQVKKGADADAEILKLRNAQAEKQKELDDLLKTSKEREEDRKRAAEEQEKLNEEAKKKQDEYINGIAEKYELESELNKLLKQSNADNIRETRSIIEQELTRNLSLEHRVELLKLQKKIEDDLKEGAAKVSPDKPDSSKEYDEAQKKLKKLQEDSIINSKINIYEREKAIDEQKKAEELAFYENAYNDQLISYEDFLRAKDIIEEQYDRKSRQRDREAFLNKINTYANLVSELTAAYNQIYSAIEYNAQEEISTWKNKEDKKLEAEREAALKQARTQAQRERINEQFDKRRDQLEEEAQKKSRERLAAWFYINKAVSATNAVIASIAAGLNTMEQLSKYMPPPLPQIAMGVTIAAGMAQAAVISQQKLPGYKKGGAVVGEEGPEIIAPFQDYASGQSKLITMTMMTLRDELRSPRLGPSLGSGASNDYWEIKAALNKLNKHLDDGISARAYLSDREARRIESRGSSLNRKNRF